MQRHVRIISPTCTARKSRVLISGGCVNADVDLNHKDAVYERTTGALRRRYLISAVFNHNVYNSKVTEKRVMDGRRG